MRATVIHGPTDIRVEEVPDAAVRTPTDAVVRVVLACICGSDLWAYRGWPSASPGSGSATSSSAWSRPSAPR